MRDRKRPPDRAIAEIAARQHGVVAHRQLMELGLGRCAIQRRVEAGRLHTLSIGVYAVGHCELSVNGHRLAAVLACGPGALLSHLDAGTLWGILPVFSGRTHVTGRRTVHGRHGIIVHRPRRLDPEDRAVVDGVPVTSVARVLLDVAPMLQTRKLLNAFAAGERLLLIDRRAIERLLERSNGHHGVGRLKAALRGYIGPASMTRSDLELLFLHLCREAGLPAPQVNVIVAGIEVDITWREHRLVVELDGYAYHRTRKAFENDRTRDAALMLAGYRVIRITHRMLADRPEEVIRTLRALLSRSPERPGGAPRGSAPALRGGPAV